MSHKPGEGYEWRPCENCGQVVAHAKDGRVLHMHRTSARCSIAGANRRLARLARYRAASRQVSNTKEADRG